MPLAIVSRTCSDLTGPNSADVPGHAPPERGVRPEPCTRWSGAPYPTAARFDEVWECPIPASILSHTRNQILAGKGNRQPGNAFIEGLVRCDGVFSALLLQILGRCFDRYISNVAGALAFLAGGVQPTGGEVRLEGLRKSVAALPDQVFDRLISENADRTIASLTRLGRI